MICVTLTRLFVSEIKVAISVITGSWLSWFPDFCSAVCERTTEADINANPVIGEGFCQVVGKRLGRAYTLRDSNRSLITMKIRKNGSLTST
jgi:hypothetical protein